MAIETGGYLVNFTNFAHSCLSLPVQAVTALIAFAFGASFLTGLTMGALLAVGFYLGREVTQAEVKAGGDPWYIGFEIRLWSKDAIYDLIVPTVACLLVCIACFFWG